jgi:diguanylate cyclase (GGDEF)-like protein
LTANHLLIALSAGLGALLLVLGGVAAALVRRTRDRADTRVDGVVAALERRMDELARELSGAVERAEDDARRSRFLGEISGSIDLDEVLERTLEAAADAPVVASALIRLEEREGAAPVVAALGLAQEEAERQSVSGPPDGRRVRAIEVGYRYADADAEAGGDDLVRRGVAVPLLDENGLLGYLTVFLRGDRALEESELHRLEEVAHRAAPAIDNARRFREARLQADLDALTSLHNRRYFHETLAREVSRAHRYNRNLALVVFDLDDFKEVNDRIGHLAGDAVLAEAAERVRAVVRTADVPCRVGGDEFAVILPESGLAQAEQLFTRIQNAISSTAIGQAGRLHLSAGVAELRAEDDSISFFERADEALYQAKEAGKGRYVAAAGRKSA